MATTDILDFLQPGYDVFTKSRDKEYFKLSTRNIAVAPRWWKIYGDLLESKGIDFNWEKVKYTDLDEHLKADETNGAGTGVYVFAVESEYKLLDKPSYVFYVGIAGEGDSGRPLRERLRQYIQISGIKKRHKVHTALEYYHRETHIHYSVLDLSSAVLSELEKILHGFYYPWANERDFPASIKTAIKCW